MGLDHEVGVAVRCHRCDGGHRCLLFEQKHLLEGDVTGLAGVAEHRSCGRQCHLAVGGARQRGHPVDLVIAQPRLGIGADVGLPHVTLRHLGQPDVCAEQRVHRQRGGALLLPVAGQDQPGVGPRGQRRVDECPVRPQDAEIECSTCTVHVRDESAQTVRHLLLAAHARQRRQPDVDAAGVLVDGVGEQGVRREFAEDAVAVFERRLDGGGEPDRVPEVVHPVVGVELGGIARVVQRRRVVRDRRLHR